MTALSLMRLIPEPPGKIVSGSVKLDGRDLLALDEPAMRKVRGKDISMIFQEPMTSLNPVMTVGNQIAEALLLHEGLLAQRCAQARGRDPQAGAHAGSRAAAAANIRISSPAACASA